MHKPIRCSASLLTVCLAVGVLGSPAPAGISVSPLRQELRVRPGETLEFKINVCNNRRAESDSSHTVALQVMDVTVSQDGALVFEAPGSQGNSASNWIRLGASELTLKPGQSAVVQCSLTAPYSAPGEYYTAIIITLDGKGRTSNGVSVTYRIASGVFVTIAGRSFPREAKITQCQVTWPEPMAQTSSSRPASEPARPEEAKVSVVLQNTGQARFDATGKIAVVDAHSRTVFSAPLTSKRPCVFGGDSRLFEASLDRPLAVGQYVVKVEMDYQSEWAKAHYQVPLEITPERAGLLGTRRNAVQQAKGLPMQVTPESLSLSVPAGAFRSLKLTLKNNAEDILRCTAGVALEGNGPIDGSWVAIAPREFEVRKSGQKTLEVAIHVPVGAPAGQHAWTVIIDAGQGRADATQIRVPLELQVKAEK